MQSFDPQDQSKEAALPRFKDRVALVTGGASGIGRAVVDRMVREHGQVIVWDIDAGKLDGCCA